LEILIRLLLRVLGVLAVRLRVLELHVFFNDSAGKFAADETEAVEHGRREQCRLQGGREVGPGKEAAHCRGAEGNERESYSEVVRHRSSTEKRTLVPLSVVSARAAVLLRKSPLTGKV